MKIGFFGVPDIARHCLEQISCAHDIRFVVASEDKPAGRNQRLRVCPSKDLARCMSIPVLHPRNMKDPGFLSEIEGYNADIFVVVAFGKIIPRAVFDMPRLKTINLHPSLLPKYRGAAPVEWALMNGETLTGVTVQLINERLDAGDILVQRQIEVAQDMNAGALYERVYALAPEMLNEAIAGLERGAIIPERQIEANATLCGKINRDTAKIKWTESSSVIHNLVRGLSLKPGAWSTIGGKVMKILSAVQYSGQDDIPPLSPGEPAVYSKKHLLIGTGTTPIEILSIQPETKKQMDALSFINGHRFKPDERFE